MNEAAFADLEGVYEDLDAEIARRGPVCRTSGVCCRFAQSGHRLYTTPLEYEYLRARTGFAGARREQAEAGVCPFLTEGRCGVRQHRMLGCRVYFCDPAYADAMPDVYERFHSRVRDVMRAHGLAYDYFNYLDRIGGELATTGGSRC